MGGCMTGHRISIALYMNLAGGPAVGTSFSVTAARKRDFAERQILYADGGPAFIAVRCKLQGFELVTSGGTITFKEDELDTLRAAPRDLSEPVR